MKNGGWIKCSDKLPEIGGEFNVVWDLEDDDDFVVTTMEYDAINKKWIDRQTQTEQTDVVLFWMDLPELPPQRPYKRESEMSLKMDKDICAQCGWPKVAHRNGFCYEYSDESTDYFYSDRTFISKKSLEKKKWSRSFNGRIIIEK